MLDQDASQPADSNITDEPDLNHSDPVSRSKAVQETKTLSAEQMEAALIDEDAAVRVAALWHRHQSLTSPQRERALCDPAASVRIAAIFSNEPMSNAQLRRAIEDPDGLVRQAGLIKQGQNR